MWFFQLHTEQIIVLNKYCNYNKPIPKISHVKTVQNLCKMRYKKEKEKSNVDCEAIRARITLKLKSLLTVHATIPERSYVERAASVIS